jgi:transcriptional regulator with GAF, ATPase, and Fis domain
MQSDLVIWVHPATASSRSIVCGALSSQGLTIQGDCPAGSRPVGVAIVERANPDELAALGNLRASSDARFVALWMAGSEPPGTLLWELLQAGASDAQLWSGPEHTPILAARLRRWLEIERVVGGALVKEHLLGESRVWRRALRRMIEIARFTDAGALVTGESGTGKELTARLIHALDPREEKGKLVVLDCSTIVPELSGSEFFGHERGAFTGANAMREGAFALANDGTLFLDEIGELPLPLQAQLLRVIQERTYKRLGSSQWQTTQFRLVCATHRDLEAEVAAGRFRGDLYYRVASQIIRLPPLRERPEDVLPLARRFLAEASPAGGAPRFDDAVKEYLLQRSYPGNVRELRQLVLRMASRRAGVGPITVGDVPEEERPAANPGAGWCGRDLDAVVRRALCQGAGLKEISQKAADAAIRIAVGDAEGNLQRAARRLGVTDRALQLRRASRGAN